MRWQALARRYAVRAILTHGGMPNGNMLPVCGRGRAPQSLYRNEGDGTMGTDASRGGAG